MKWVYSFDEAQQQIELGDQDRSLDLFGAKGSRLVEMMRLGLPVPPGFIITTEACQAYYEKNRKLPNGLWAQVLDALDKLGSKTGLSFGSPEHPFLVSVRSGAKFSMPGMMDTIPNVGLTEDTFRALVRFTDDHRFVYDCYRRLLSMFAKARSEFGSSTLLQALVELDTATQTLAEGGVGVKGLERAISAWLKTIHDRDGRDLLEDPHEQLRAAIQAVFDSWNSDRAVKHRAAYKIPDDLGTATTIQLMVFGNIGAHSGTGVVFSRNQLTGEKGLYGEYIPTAQGDDLVSGARTPLPIQQLHDSLPDVYKELSEIVDQLERRYRAVQDVEFTIERGKLWILQSRNAKPSAAVAVKVAVQMVNEELIRKSEAVSRITPGELDFLSRPRFSPQARAEALRKGRLLTKGIPASSGAATGQAIFSTDAAARLWDLNKPAILVCKQVSPEDVQRIRRATGVIASQGGASSHAALIARELNRVCVVGCADLEVHADEDRAHIKDRVLREGDEISVDGTTGEVFLGKVETVVPEDFAELREFKQWYESHSPWANAVAPENEAIVNELRAIALAMKNNPRWITEKANVVELLGKMIPPTHAIRQVVVKADDEEALRREMLAAVRHGYWTGPRTCYYPNPKLGKARWQMAIQTEQEVEAFIRDPGFRLGTPDEGKGSLDSGGYPTWIADENLREIIIPFDPPRKGLPEFRAEHFVFTVSYRSSPDSIEVEANLGTDQLRSLESASPSDLMHIVMLIEPETPDHRGRRTLSFGRRYLKPEILGDVTSTMRILLGELMVISTGGDSQARNIAARQLLSSGGYDIDRVTRDICLRLLAVNAYPSVDQVDEQVIATKLSEAMRSPDWTGKLHEYLVKPDALSVARSISQMVFETWWTPPFELPVVMQALDEATDLNTLEVQGRFDSKGRIGFMLVYGAKGVEERSNRILLSSEIT